MSPLKILQWLLLLASSSNSAREVSFEKVPLRSLAKINPFPSLPTTQLQLRFRGRRQGLSNVGKEGTSWTLALCPTEKLQQCTETTGCHITGIALFALLSCNTSAVYYVNLTGAFNFTSN